MTFEQFLSGAFGENYFTDVRPSRQAQLDAIKNGEVFTGTNLSAKDAHHILEGYHRVPDLSLSTLGEKQPSVGSFGLFSNKSTNAPQQPEQTLDNRDQGLKKRK